MRITYREHLYPLPFEGAQPVPYRYEAAQRDAEATLEFLMDEKPAHKITLRDPWNVVCLDIDEHGVATITRTIQEGDPQLPEQSTPTDEQAPWVAMALLLGPRVSIEILLKDARMARLIAFAGVWAFTPDMAHALASEVAPDHADHLARELFARVSPMKAHLGGIVSLESMLADVLKEMRSPQNEQICRKNASTRQGVKLWAAWIPPASERPCFRIEQLCRAIYDDVIRPTIGQPIRYPTDLARTQVGGRITGGTRRHGYIHVVPPQGIALMLPFDETRVSSDRETLPIRQVLTDTALRTYLATMILYQDDGLLEDGSFVIPDGVSTILDMIGSARSAQGYHPGRSRAIIESHFELFSRTLVRQVGDIEHIPGDSLLSRVRERSSGRTVCYAHSRLVVGALRPVARESGSRLEYLQIPRATCRLEAYDIPYALGLAIVTREHAYGLVARRRPIEIPLPKLLESAGVDWADRERKQGNRTAYWATEAGRVAKIAELSTFGRVDTAGVGRETIVTIRPSDSLLRGYEPLRRRKHARKAATHKP